MIEEMVLSSRKRKATQFVASSKTKRSKNNKKSNNVTTGRPTRRTEYCDELRDGREDNSKFDISDDDSAGGGDGYDSTGRGMEDYRETQNNSSRNESDLDDSNEQEEGGGDGFESDPYYEVEEHDDAKQEEERNKRQMQLIRVYSQGTQLLKNDTTLRTLTKSLQKLIIPHVKFVQCSKVFGSFDQPDFTSADCWQNKLFSNIPSLNNARDEMKAQVWMTYRSKLKEQFSLHRSGVTLKIKRKFEEGKWVSYSELNVAT